MEKVESRNSIKSLDIIEIDPKTGSNTNIANLTNSLTSLNNESDLFSHDSTHVRLVIEAEKQTNLARERCASILQKLSMDVQDTDKEAAHILSKLSMEVVLPEKDSIEAVDTRDESDNENSFEINGGGMNFDNFRIPPVNADDDHSHHSDDDEINNNNMFEQMETPNDIDIEHLRQCILPLSPSGIRKGRRKRISGQFEFKKMNSVLTVVKSFDNQSFALPKESRSPRSPRTPTPTKPRRSKSRLSFRRKSKVKSEESPSSSAVSLNESNAITDDEKMIEEICDKEEKNDDKKKHSLSSPKSPKKEKRAGDLPPRITKQSVKGGIVIGSIGTGSIGAIASDAEREDVVSVYSSISDLSEESVTQKIKKGPFVVTEASMRPVRIPDILSLKAPAKPTTFGKIKRKLSFNRSSKASF